MKQIISILWIILILGLIAFIYSCKELKNESLKNSAQIEYDWQVRAKMMVDRQIRNRGVQDERVLKVMTETPRHLFIPEYLWDNAYLDSPLPIGEGQTISQPYIVGLMTELLELSGTEKVLEIGTGSGYQAAVLSPMAKKVYSIEIIEILANSASALLQKLGHQNLLVKCGDGYLGWPEFAPFDRIIVTAAPDEVPEKLVEQLAVNGRMVLPVGTYYQELIVITKNDDGSINRETIIPVRFVPMIHGKN